MDINSFKYKANYFAALLLAFVLPLERRFIAPATIFFVITSLINFQRPLSRNYNHLYFGIIYLIYLSGLFFAPNMNDATNDLLTKLPLVLFPVSFYFSKLNFRIHLPNISILFVLGCTIAFLISFAASTFTYGATGELSSFFYDHISYFSHPGYMALLCNFSILILLILRSSLNVLPKWFSVSLIVVHSAYIILLSSKTGLITLLLTYLTYVLYLIIYHKKYITGLVILLAAFTGLITTYYSSELFRNRILEVTSVFQDDQTSSTSARTIIWDISLDLIREKPMLGYGAGNENLELENRYLASENDYLIEQKLNAHNQFLQTTLATGITGGIILLMMLLIPLWLAIRNKNPLYLGFIILLIVNFLTESMLERQVGVTFYAFFNLILFTSYCVSDSNRDPKCT